MTLALCIAQTLALSPSPNPVQGRACGTCYAAWARCWSSLTLTLAPKPDPSPHPETRPWLDPHPNLREPCPEPCPNSDPDPDPCPVAKQVVELMADGRTRVRLDSGEEHRYRPNSMLKFSAARE